MACHDNVSPIIQCKNANSMFHCSAHIYQQTKKNSDSIRLLFFWYMKPQQCGIGSKRCESMDCPRLHGSKFRPLSTFRDISEEHAASFLRIEQLVYFYHITQDHVPNVFSHYHQNLTPHPEAYFIKVSPAVRELK